MIESKQRKETKLKTKQLHLRVTSKEEAAIEEGARKRGISKTDYVKEKIFSKSNTDIYNRAVEQAVYNVSELLIKDIEKYCTDEKFIKKCKQRGKELWLSLK